MISNPFNLISVLSSSFLAFITVAVLVEVIIKIARFKQFRIRAMLRLLPIVGLLIDFILTGSNLTHWINPLSCCSCVQKILLEVFFPQLQAHLTENQQSLINYLGTYHGYRVISVSLIMLFGVSLILFLRKCFQVIILFRELRFAIKQGTFCNPTIENPLLKEALESRKVKIYTSCEVAMPLAASTNIILIPDHLTKLLNNQEFEAVVAHELEHLHHLDPFIRIFYHLTTAIFWWVPLQGWIKKIELDQEMACDHNIVKYGLNADLIAFALVKVARNVRPNQALCYFSNDSNPIISRLKAALGLWSAKDEQLMSTHLVGIALGGIFLFMCIQWL